jgi:adenine-specific DNA glycosylase
LNAAANILLDTKNPSDWNESMMELGAVICTPRVPRCEACPVSEFCRARALGIQNELPAKRVKRETENVTLAAAILLDSENRTMLIRPAKEKTKSDSAGLFSNLWQFPGVVVREEAQADIAEELRRLFKSKAIARKLEMQSLDKANHTVTFRRITLAPYLIRVTKLPPADDRTKTRIALSAVAKLAVSSATRKIAVSALKAITSSKK